MIWRKTSSIDRLERIILVRKFGKMQVIGTLKSFSGVLGTKAGLECIQERMEEGGIQAAKKEKWNSD